MRKTLYLFVVVLFFACRSNPVPEEIIIEGNVQGVPDGKIYLANAFRASDVKDSADCVDGRFKFVIKPDSSFVPYLATIYSGNPAKLADFRAFVYRNHMKGADSMKKSISGFYLERGLTRISGDNSKTPYLRVFAGPETDLVFAKGFTFRGPEEGSLAARRKLYIDRKGSGIRKHPYSYFLLQDLFFAKADYREAELKDLFALFDADVRASKLGDDFRTYFSNRPDPGQVYPKLSLLTSEGQRRPVFKPAAKLNMLVFWASWCTPCREEIPVIREIEQEYRGKGLNLVSISIDEHENRWTKALSEEKMAWPQYIADSDKIRYLQETFNLASVPLVVFTDNNGVEVARITGNGGEGDKKRFQDVISRYL